MFSLDSILRAHATPITSIEAGSDQLRKGKRTGEGRKIIDKEQFRKQLASLRSTNSWCVAALTAMIVMVLLTTMFLVSTHLNDAPLVMSLFVGFATVTAGLSGVILAMFKVLQRSRVLYILSESLDGASLQTVVDVLAEK